MYQIFKFIFILCLSMGLSLTSVAGKNTGGRQRKTYQKENQLSEWRKSTGTYEQNSAKLPSAGLARNCSLSTRHYVFLLGLVVGGIVAWDLQARNADIAGSEAMLPYRFEPDNSNAAISYGRPSELLPEPFLVPIIDTKNTFCEPERNPSDTTFLNVVRPGQINHGENHPNLAAVSEESYEECTRKGACQIGKEEIVCKVSPSDKTVVVDSIFAGRTMFEHALYGEAWRFLESFLNDENNASIDGFFVDDYKNFNKNLRTLNHIILLGAKDLSSFRDPNDSVDFFLLTDFFPFNNIDSWSEIVRNDHPEFLDSFSDLMHIADHLPEYIIDAPSFLKNRYQFLTNNGEELPFKIRINFAFKYAAYSNVFSRNAFLNKNFAYIQAYSHDEYDALLLELLINTKLAFQEDPVTAAAYFLARFTQIRPFSDGNGRLARLIVNYILRAGGHDPVVFLSEQQYFEMCVASWTEEKYLPLELVLRREGQKPWDAKLPFKTFLQQLVCRTSVEKAFIRKFVRQLQNCRKNCQELMDQAIIDAGNGF